MSAELEPKIERVRAIDVRPYHWGIWCTVGGQPNPFTNPIVSARRSEDGKKLWFMLESHNFQDAAPEEILDLVPLVPPGHMINRIESDHAELIAKRPKGPTPSELVETAARALLALTDEQRAALFARYCRWCGGTDPHCNCTRDE